MQDLPNGGGGAHPEPQRRQPLCGRVCANSGGGGGADPSIALPPPPERWRPSVRHWTHQLPHPLYVLKHIARRRGPWSEDRNPLKTFPFWAKMPIFDTNCL